MSRRRRNQKPKPKNQPAAKQQVSGVAVVDTDGTEDLAKKIASTEAALESTAAAPAGEADGIQIESISEKEESTLSSESLQVDYVTAAEPEEKKSASEAGTDEEASGLEVDWADSDKAKKGTSRVRRGEREAVKENAAAEPEKKEPEKAAKAPKAEKAESSPESEKKAAAEKAEPKDEAAKAPKAEEKKAGETAEASAPASKEETGKKRDAASGRKKAPSGKKQRKAPVPEGIELTDADTEEAKAKQEAEEKGWVFPEVKDDEKSAEEDKTAAAAKKPKAAKKVSSWWHHLKRGVRIAITVLVCIVLFGLGYFHYEYSRLQKDQSAAYTDEYVAKLKAEEDNSSVAKSAEEDMEKNLADVAEADTVKAEGEIFQDSSVYNILLIGTDDRTEKFSTDARGDTCILLSINKNTGKVTLASFERGTGVPVLWGPYEGQWDWLTHTFRYGGAQMMVEEIRDNYLVDVNRYIRINIRTLVKLIDAIGGVDIDLTEAEANHLDNPEGTFTEGYAKGIGMEDKEQFDLTAGVNHLNGVTAMVYARTRYIDDDWHRVQRQRKVIMAAAEKLSKLSASEMISTLDAVIPLVQTDLSETEVAELLTLAPVFMGAEIQQITIPADGTYGSMKGMDGRSMYAVDFNANAKILKEMLYGITDEEAEEQVNEEGGTAATDYTNTSRTSGYVSDESVTAEDAQNAQASKAAQDTVAANAMTSSTSGTTGSGTSSGTTSSSTSLQQQTATQEVEQAMNVPQTTTTDTQNAAAGTSDAAAAGTDAAGTATVGTGVSVAAGDSATDYAALQAQYQQQADSLNQAATANQAAATQAAAQALDESLSDEERAAAQEQANQLAVQAQQQAVAAQQAQVQANAAAAQAAAGTGDGSAAGN